MTQERCRHCDRPIIWNENIGTWIHPEFASVYCDLSGILYAEPDRR